MHYALSNHPHSARAVNLPIFNSTANIRVHSFWNSCKENEFFLWSKHRLTLAHSPIVGVFINFANLFFYVEKKKSFVRIDDKLRFLTSLTITNDNDDILYHFPLLNFGRKFVCSHKSLCKCTKSTLKFSWIFALARLCNANQEKYYAIYLLLAHTQCVHTVIDCANSAIFHWNNCSTDGITIISTNIITRKSQ